MSVVTAWSRITTGLLVALLEERASWFNWFPVLVGLGIALYFCLPSEPTLAAAAVPLIVGIVALANSGERAAPMLAAAILVLVGSGLVLAKARALTVSAPVLARSLKSVEVTGYIEAVEPRAPRGVRLTIWTSTVGDLDGAGRPRRVRIRALGKRPDGAGTVLLPGAAIRVRAHLEPPAPPALPGDYDFARQAWFQRIGAVGYTFETPTLDANAPPPPWWLGPRALVESIRLEIAARIGAALPGEPGALATALITGERGGISAETTAAYRDAGLIHMLSISGLHMAVMAGAVFGLIRLGLAAVPALALYWPLKKLAAIGGMAATLAYLAISGAAAATVRSAIMMLVVFLAVLLGRPAIALRNVALTALCILAAFPESLLDVGFQMSFAAVVALVSAYEAIGRWRGDDPRPLSAVRRGAAFLLGIVLSTLIAGAAVAPLGIYHFHTSQQYAVLANLIAIPVANLLVMPAALFTLALMPIGLEWLPLHVMGLGIEIIGATARAVAVLPGSVTAVGAISEAGFLLMIAGGLWLALWRARWRLFGLVGIVSGIAIAPATRPPDIIAGLVRREASAAVRTPAGGLVPLSAALNSFEWKRWLEHDGGQGRAGDGRLSKALCDPLGCSATSGGMTIVVSRHPAGLADDCRRADILILNAPRPERCDNPRLVVDREAFDAGGAHAVWIGASGEISVLTVGGHQGQRPWTVAGGGGGRRLLSGRIAPGQDDRGHGRAVLARLADRDRLGTFASPSLAEAVAGASPAGPDEIDASRDEEWP